MTQTLGDYLNQHTNKLPDELMELDAQVLLAHVLERPRTWLLAHLDAPLSAPMLESANQAFSRLEAGEPLPYILGHWEFFGRDFDITPDVLIPRPETELLVEKAIKWLSANPLKRSVADIGTGSGIIAASIAMNVPDAKILATDISPAALKVAQKNSIKFNVQDRIRFVQCNLLPQEVDSNIDLLCANLPYIPTQTMQELPIYGREPTLALDGGEDGLDLYRSLLEIAPRWLSQRSLMLFEIEASQGMKALSLAYDKLSNATINLHKDLAGHNRLLEIRLHPS
ncbi:MAG: peptide chain release factor N(5)-glutamine methyltransferase [Anaerolineales bacterium]|nr:peptide chain release factor N(5)-glutamine methyltransferase [Anaerolineales bacterium]MCB9146634.1 peptide chain release factor N(5)-glutamine methyltransferase [Anaerolineales bacterium]